MRCLLQAHGVEWERGLTSATRTGSRGRRHASIRTLWTFQGRCTACTGRAHARARVLAGTFSSEGPDPGAAEELARDGFDSLLTEQDEPGSLQLAVGSC